MKHNPLKSTSAGICQVITSLVHLPGSTLCYSLILQLLCLSLSAHLSEFEIFSTFVRIFFSPSKHFSVHLLVLILLFDSPSHPSLWSPSFLSPSLFFSPSLCCSRFCWGSERTARHPVKFHSLFTSISCHVHIFFLQDVFIAKKKIHSQKNSLYRIPHSNDA